LKQVVASVIDNGKILPKFTRPHARTILSSQIIWLKCPEVALEAQPGQFVMVRCGGECILPRPFSIHQVNDGNIALFFAVWEDGKGTNWLSQRQKGDTVELFGPLGNGFSIHPNSHNLLLVAGGIGIAPLCFLAQEALRRECLVALLYGTADKNRYPEHLFPPQIELVAATEDGTVGKRGIVTDLVLDYVDWADQTFVCGPMPMYRTIAARNPKTKPVQISLEMRMGCGRGVCYGCTVKTKAGLKKVCQDGPVFNLEDILWDELNC